MLDERRYHPTIHLNRRPGYKRRSPTRKESDHRRELAWIPRPARRNSRRPRFEDLVDRSLLALRPHSSEVHRALRIEVTRKHAVHGHAIFRHFVGERLGEAKQA